MATARAASRRRHPLGAQRPGQRRARSASAAGALGPSAAALLAQRGAYASSRHRSSGRGSSRTIGSTSARPERGANRGRKRGRRRASQAEPMRPANLWPCALGSALRDWRLCGRAPKVGRPRRSKKIGRTSSSLEIWRRNKQAGKWI